MSIGLELIKGTSRRIPASPSLSFLMGKLSFLMGEWDKSILCLVGFSQNLGKECVMCPYQCLMTKNQVPSQWAGRPQS